MAAEAQRGLILMYANCLIKSPSPWEASVNGLCFYSASVSFWYNIDLLGPRVLGVHNF